MRTRDRLGWMLCGVMLTAFVLFGCNVVDVSGGPTATVARGEQAAQATAEAQLSGEPQAPDEQPGQLAPVSQADLGGAVSAVYDRGNPSVVQIDVRSSQGGGLGTGFVIDKNGHVVTNYHVIAGASREGVVVTFLDEQDYMADVVGFDQDSDLAVLRVRDAEPSMLVPAELGDSSALRVGQFVVAIGNPLGESRTATLGIVSALRPAKNETNDPSAFLIPGVIQTDAAINPGNSGGPLFDMAGRVIGVNTFIASRGGVAGNIGIGYAVPVNLVKRVVPAIIADGRYVHPFLGVQMATISRLAAQQNDLPAQGVLISGLTAGGPAARGGLAENDLIQSIDGEDVSTSEEVIAFLEFNTRPGDTVTFSVIDAQGRAREVAVEVGERPGR